MNEAETRAELIDPMLKACGWGVVDGCKSLLAKQISKAAHGSKTVEPKTEELRVV
jgi:type I site-specific restriction endonuclease